MFGPSVTTNGMCYTFNGEGLTKGWRSSELMDTFERIFPHEDVPGENFGGSGPVQGNIDHTYITF